MRTLLFIIFCCIAVPALAADKISPSTDIIDHESGLLKKEYRTCTTNEGCTYLANVCKNWLAVSTASRNHVRAVLAKISEAAKCGGPPDDAPRPVSECVEGFCAIAPGVRR